MQFNGERFIPEIFDKSEEIYAEHFNRYKAVLRYVENKIVLDAACGVGYGSNMISIYANTVYGIDINEESINYAKNHFDKENLNFIRSSIERLPFKDHSIDVIVSFETIEHVNENVQCKFLSEIGRVLKENGVLFISTPNKMIYSDKNNFKNEFHVKEFYENEFYIFLKKRFKYLKTFYQNEEIVNIITNNDNNYFLNTTDNNKNNKLEKKYIIVVCSNYEIEGININSFFMRRESLNKLYNRVEELQNEVEEKNQWALRLDKTLNEIYNSKWYKIYRFISHLLKRLLNLQKEQKMQINLNIITRFFYYFKNQIYKLLIIKIKEKVFHNKRKKINLSIISDIGNCEKKIIFKKNDSPEVSIIIPVYNKFDYTYKCLKSIRNNVKFENYEIIIADDNSDDEKIKNIKNYIDNIKIIKNKNNLGFLENCNNATKYTRGNYLLFLNNDTQVQENWLESLLELIKSDEKIGMVGSKLVYPDGRLQEAGGIIWKDASGWNFGRLDDPTKPEYNYVKEVDYISGASIMIRKDLWDEIGGFDERYRPAYYEDVDLAFEVRKHGYKVLFQPKSLIVHFEGISHGTDINSGVKKYQVINKDKFMKKWRNILKREHFESSHHIFLSRDRSCFKPHMLYIDHYIPHYDQDAGSRAAYQYLTFFVNMGMQIHFIGDNFLDYLDTPYLRDLEQLGIEVLYGSYYANHWREWFVENQRYFKYIILSRPHIAIKYIDFMQQHSTAKIIYMGHDLHFLREKREYEIKKEVKYLRNSNKWKKQEMKLISKADISWFFSGIEKKKILEICPNAKINVIPLYIFNECKQKVPTYSKRKDIMFVGGFNHSPNVDAMLWFMKEIWPFIKKNIPDIKFYIIGSNPTDKIKRLKSYDVIVTGYVDDKTLKHFYGSCKVVVAPLRYGAGVKGKIVEAIYYKIPIVTTSIGAEGFEDAETVMVVEDNPRKFAQAVINLYKDKRLAYQYSIKEKEYCEKFFSVEAAYRKVFNDIFE